MTQLDLDHPVAHYGDFFAEQRAMVAGRGLVVRPDLAAATIVGPDAERFLHSILSQSLTGLAVGASREALLLEPTGRVQEQLRLVRTEDGFVAYVSAARLEGIVDWKNRMRFMMRVETAPLAGTVVVADTLEGNQPIPGAPSWIDPWPGVVDGGYAYGEPDEDAWWRVRLTAVPREGLAEALAGVVERQGLRLCGMDAYTALRIAAHRPEFDAEVDERTIPHELDWARTAVHLNKGCYRGQETVAKVHNLGHPPRRLVLLDLDGTDPTLPEPGAEVRSGDRVVGRVTSVARHYEDGPIALAVVKRGTPADATLEVAREGEWMPAAQRVLVAPDAGGLALDTVRSFRAAR